MPFALPQMLLNAKEAARKMIERDFNHPCILFWSVSNESNESVPQIRQMNNSLIRYVKALDDSRLVVHVSYGRYLANPEIRELLFTQDDVICINAYVTTDHIGADPAPDNIEVHDQYAASFWDDTLAFFREKYPG